MVTLFLYEIFQNSKINTIVLGLTGPIMSWVMMSNDYWRYVILFPVKLTEFSLLIYFYAVTAKDIFTQRADKQLRVYNIHKHKRNTTNYAFIHAWKICNGQIVKSRHKRWSFRRDRESWSIRRIYISHLWQICKNVQCFYYWKTASLKGE